MDLKNKIELHGNSLKDDAVFGLIRMLMVLAVFAYFTAKGFSTTAVLLMALYVVATLYLTRKKIRNEKKYFKFQAGNPVYDKLTQYGDPDEILSEIDKEFSEKRVLYSAPGNAKKASAETIITENYFVHMNKRSYVIPLKEVVCAYMYDRTLRVSPPEGFVPTRFKPAYLIITYGRAREAIILYSSINYEKVLNVLEERLHCNVEYTRELGTLYNTDYEGFKRKIEEIKKGKEGESGA